MNQIPQLDIKAIIGLGNPGPKFYYTRHNIGFRVVDALAHNYNLSWQKKDNAEIATFEHKGKKILLVKPQTFMNDSGKVIHTMFKQDIRPENILVVHDELELPFGQIKLKIGGSAKGHNGLKSIIAACGDTFARLRIGIDRPANREDVPDYVLKKFDENDQKIEDVINQSVAFIEKILN